MPSRLTTYAINYATRGVGQVRAKLESVADPLPMQSIQMKGPYAGLMPDIDPNLTDGTSFTDLTNVLARAHGEDHGEVLGLPDGYRQVDNARLPLGDASPPATATTSFPVVRLDQLARFSPTGHADDGELSGEFILTPMAVTAGSGTGGTGQMYRIAANSQWTIVLPSAATAAARQLSAGRDGPATPLSQTMPDSCAAPFGATARATTTAAPGDNLQTGPIREPCWIVTNNVDEVMVFPSCTTGAAGTLSAVHRYEPLTAVASLDLGGTDGFKAKSCETWNGRVYFLNTSEAGVRRQQRLRRTAKFTADPDPTIVGAGHYDFREFQGEGLRIETLGDVLAVYFSDGVAFVRPTGVPTSPDEPQILSTERGLLSTHSVCAIGRNVHFGIFTDGWWLIDQSGRWQELGVVNINDKIVPKWRQTFYEGLPSNQRHRLYCYYDSPANLIYIARPTIDHAEPQEIWIYDPTSDRVFIENYPVTCFGTFTPATQAGVTIDSLPGSIDSLTGTIDSYGSVPGFPKVRVHGDLAGFVYQHRRDIAGYHGQEITTGTPTVQDPSWSFSTGLRSLSGFRNSTCIDRVSLEYFNHDNPTNVSVEVHGPSADGSQARYIMLNGGNHEDVRYRDAWFRYSSPATGLRVSGAGEFHIRSLAVDYWTDPSEPRGI